MAEGINLIKKNKKLNLFISCLFFVLIFLFYLNYPTVSSKAYLIVRSIEGRTAEEYGIWGYFNEYSFRFLNFLTGDFINNFLLMEMIIGFQIALIWALCVYQMLIKLNFYSIIIFCHPFILNFFSLCPRDSITIGLIFLLLSLGFNRIKIALSIFVSFIIHKGTLPLIFLSSILDKLKINSKKSYLFLVLISILSAFIINFLLRHTDFYKLVPEFLYRNIFYYPRIAFIQSDKDFNSVGLVNNIYGNINFKLLFFGIFGQLACTYFKDNFPNKIFYLSFSTFFICSLFSSVPNANRFVYHSFLISIPFLFDIFLLKTKNIIKNI